MPRTPKNAPLVCEYFAWHLRKRDGVYFADARSGKFKLGKHSLGTRDHDEALKRLRQLDRKKAIELGLAEPKAVSAVGPISIADGWRLFLDYSGRSGVLGGVSPDSHKRYRAVRDKHVEFCSRQGVADWNSFDVCLLEKYGNQLAKHHADRTAYFELTLLKSVNGWLVKHKHLSPADKLIYPLRKPQGTDTYCYAMAEVSAMVAHCQQKPNRTWLAEVIITLAHTGLRISELAGLRWTDVNLEQNLIMVADERSSRRKQKAGTARMTKGRRSRTIPIHPTLKKLLLAIERQPDGMVLHAPQGGRLRPRNVLHDLIRDAIEPLTDQFPTPEGEIGFEHGRLHSFRHFFCSQAFLGGASEGEIREWLGHADSKMVEHYRHLRREDAQRKMDKIDFLLPPDPPPAGAT